MIDDALVEQDAAKREKMYNDIELYLNDIVPIVPIATSYVNIGDQEGTYRRESGTAQQSMTTAILRFPNNQEVSAMRGAETPLAL